MIHSREKEKWIIYTLVVLSCLVLASFWLMCNIYARYSTETSGSDSARVARFNVTMTGEVTQPIKIDVYPGFTQIYNVEVINNSEVAIDYVMELNNKYGNLPLEMKMLDSDGKEITSKTESIAAGDTTSHTYQLEISWPRNSEGQTDLQEPDYAGKTDVIEITLKAMQKD